MSGLVIWLPADFPRFAREIKLKDINSLDLPVPILRPMPVESMGYSITLVHLVASYNLRFLKPFLVSSKTGKSFHKRRTRIHPSQMVPIFSDINNALSLYKTCL